MANAVAGKKKGRGAPKKKPSEKVKSISVWLSPEVYDMCAVAGDGIASRGARLLLIELLKERNRANEATKRN